MDVLDHKETSVQEDQNIDTEEKITNKALASYIKKILGTSPIVETAEDPHKVKLVNEFKRSVEFKLDSHRYIDSVYFWSTEPLGGQSEYGRYSMEVFYRGDAPENVMEYTDYHGQKQRDKRISSSFRFSLYGLGDLYTTTESMIHPHGDLKGRKKKILDTPMDLEDEEVRKRMVISTLAPTENEPSGGYGIYLQLNPKGQISTVFDILHKLHQQDLEQFPNVDKYEDDFRKGA